MLVAGSRTTLLHALWPVCLIDPGAGRWKYLPESDGEEIRSVVGYDHALQPPGQAWRESQAGR